MVQLKTDAEQIKAFLEELVAKDWIQRTERRWWPQFVFHYTDIQNAARVLQDGYLYSRKRLEDTRRLMVSSGSPKVLSGTSSTIKDCVRLYFRPKTATQYYTEGIHSQLSLEKSRFPEAHCPVPVFFLFNAADILTRADCSFSSRGLGATDYQILSTAQELRQLPWPKIYHTGWIASDSTREIIAHRMAEVIVPQQLDLSALRFIYCRSDAEKDTLMHLLPRDLQQSYQKKTFATTRNDLFFRRRTFVEQVTLFPDTVKLHFSPDTESPGPFHLRVELTNGSGQAFVKEETTFILRKPYTYTQQLPVKESRYSIRFLLDDHLAYENSYEEMNIPF